MPHYVIAALYKFVALPDSGSLISALNTLCQHNHIKGSLLLAAEGINGTIAGKRENIDAVVAFLKQDVRFNGLEYKESFSPFCPFKRLKVKAKKEIATLGVENINPACQTGIYVDAKDWNKLIEDPDVTVIDVRNAYEYDIGTFKNAINPDTQSFRQFPEFIKKNLDPRKHKKIAMGCTGGIRVEKAASYMLAQGFEQVFHLKGGILKYLETVKPEESLWQGECFVFDERVTVKHGLEKGNFDLCRGCRRPVSAHARKSVKYIEGVVCPSCFDDASAQKIRRAAARHHQMTLSKNHVQAQARTSACEVQNS
jgi:UPF0176 protein